MCSHRLATMFAFILFILLSPSAALASSGVVARHGITEAEYQRMFNTWVPRGYRLTHIDGFSTGQSKYRFNVVFIKRPRGPEWKASHGLTDGQFVSQLTVYHKAGWRLVHVDGYRTGPKATLRYATIWEKNTRKVKWYAQHAMSSKRYTYLVNDLAKKGWTLERAGAYQLDHKLNLYYGIWTKRAGPKQIALHDMSPRTYQNNYNTWKSKGYRLMWVDGYNEGSKSRFLAIWSKTRAVEQVAHHNMSGAGYQIKFKHAMGKNMLPHVVSGYRVGSGIKYAAIFVGSSTRKRPSKATSRPRSKPRSGKVPAPRRKKIMRRAKPRRR